MLLLLSMVMAMIVMRMKRLLLTAIIPHGSVLLMCLQLCLNDTLFLLPPLFLLTDMGCMLFMPLLVILLCLAKDFTLTITIRSITPVMLMITKLIHVMMR